MTTKQENQVEILLVEDNPTDAEMTIRALKKSHLANHIEHVEDGEEALNFLYCQGRYQHYQADSVKLILLDLKLPKISGLEVLRKIKNDPKRKNIPVVVLTSSSVEKDIVESYHLNVNSYIVKPVDFDQFVHAIGQIGFYWMVLNTNNPE